MSIITIKNQRLSRTEVFNLNTGTIEFKFEVEAKEGETFKYVDIEITLNEFTHTETVQLTPKEFTVNLPISELNMGNNTLSLQVNDTDFPHSPETWSYEIVKEDRNTFSLARRFEHSTQWGLTGAVKFNSGEGYTLNRNIGQLGNITGEALIEIPTTGKSKIDELLIASATEDQVVPEDIELNMNYSRELEDGFKEYKRTIKKSDFNNINSIDIV